MTADGPNRFGVMGALQEIMELARGSGERPEAEVLALVARSIQSIAGYQAVMVQLYRPRWDGYETVFVLGDTETQNALLGIIEPRHDVAQLPGTPIEPLPGMYFIAGAPGMWDAHQEIAHKLPAAAYTGEGSDAWTSDDFLVMRIDDDDGSPLGAIGVDAPHSGRRPTESEFRLLDLMRSFARQALRINKRTTEIAEDRWLLTMLGEVSSHISAATDHEGLYVSILRAITPGLRFGRAALYLRNAEDDFSLWGSEGSDSGSPALPRELAHAHVQSLFGHEALGVGCWLVDAGTLYGSTRDARDSARGSAEPDPLRLDRSGLSGRGPLAWLDRVLLIRWETDQSSLAGFVVIDEPADGLLPRDARLRVLHQVIAMGAAVGQKIDQRMELHRHANHDALTGLRNRRGLHELIADSTAGAILLCDIDHFKGVNDRYGHDTGDRVLAIVGTRLTESLLASETAVRLGGDEFCVIMPNADRDRAVRLAEQVQESTAIFTRALMAEPVTLSIGVAVYASVLAPQDLLDLADQALYAAKHAGPDRVVVKTAPGSR